MDPPRYRQEELSAGRERKKIPRLMNGEKVVRGKEGREAGKEGGEEGSMGS